MVVMLIFNMMGYLPITKISEKKKSKLYALRKILQYTCSHTIKLFVFTITRSVLHLDLLVQNNQIICF